LEEEITFVPGLLIHVEQGLLLSKGLTARIIAQSGQLVEYQNTTYGNRSSLKFHGMPDFGATFKDRRLDNPGGFVYVSNSEMETPGAGAVGSITFDRHGNVLRYELLLNGTTKNCGGGTWKCCDDFYRTIQQDTAPLHDSSLTRHFPSHYLYFLGSTPWGTWISCEETKGGRSYQVDPTGKIPALPITLGNEGGYWESFAYDVRDKTFPRFFVTEDAERGALQRFTPHNPIWDPPADAWLMLHGQGAIEYLLLKPNSDNTSGTFSWGSNRALARNNAGNFYPNSEGIDVYEGRLVSWDPKIG
jgi:hypothetical protein